MSDTGGGHRASAEAIREGIEALYPGQYEIIIDDIWKRQAPWPLNALPAAYGWVTGPGLPVWRLLWRLSNAPRRLRYIFAAVAPLVKPNVVRYLKTVQPDLVVSVHPLMNHLGLTCLKAAGIDVPFVTVVTDLVSFHLAWICPDVTHCIVPTEPARQRALALGMPRRKLSVRGQPVSLRFAMRTESKEALRRQLALDIDRYALLLVGGGEGSGRLYRIAHQLAHTVPNIQLLIVTGRNRALNRQLSAVDWAAPTRVYGFVDNMPALMQAADILITKAGPGAISEAFITGLPSILISYIPGQETGNVAYVQTHGAGVYGEDPKDIAQLVLSWLTPDNATVPRMVANATRLARPQASLEIAAELCRYL